MLYLSACTPVQSNNICPPIVLYTKVQQKEAADELKSCPKCGEIDSQMEDYEVTRDQSRVCQ
jgi:transcription initiation factor IIE alpha subunit